jgi:glutathione S-transferase
LDKSRAHRIIWLLEELKLEYELKTFKRGADWLAPKALKDIHPLGKSPVVGIQPEGADQSIILAESGTIIEYLSDHFGTWLVPKRYLEGKEGTVGGETEEWFRYRVSFYLDPLHIFSRVYNVHTLSLSQCNICASYSLPDLANDMPVSHALCRGIAHDGACDCFGDDQYECPAWDEALTDNEIDIRKAPVPFFLKPITNGIANKVDSSFVDKELKTHLTFLEDYLTKSPNGGEFFCGAELTGADFMMFFVLEGAVQRAPLNETSYPKLYAYVRRMQARDAYRRALQRATEASGEEAVPFSDIKM